MKPLRAALGLTIIFLFSAICFAQVRPQKPPEKASEKDKKENSLEKSDKPIEVKANILVWDAQGLPTDDVKQEDLKIYEDGVEQGITYFSKKDDVLNIGLVMDNTGSMRGVLDEYELAASALIENLREKDETFIVRFVSSDKIEKLQDWTREKALLQKSLASMFIEGGPSAITDALHVSGELILAREKVERSRRHALVLFSDGEDRDSYYRENQLFELLKGSDVQIFAVALTYNLDKKARIKAANFINNLALKTGGTAFILDNGNNLNDSLSQAVKAIINELRSQYIVGYTSTNEFLDAKPRKLTIEVADNAKGEKRRAFIRESFVVPEIKSK